ncbi:YmaF family protein [Brevibacillus formosus]|uniref:YmaF family protein n=1 Tax=Brevibacillus formosus TaxID=54913 RepID=UPI000B5A3D20
MAKKNRMKWKLKRKSPTRLQRHVHFVSGSTTFNDGHVHRFKIATLIQKPLL